MAHSSGTAARGWALGGMVFAATMMLMLGIWQVIVGIAAIAEDDVFVTVPEYVYEIDTTAWGWIHLVVGAVVALAGLALFSGATWARAVGIGLAMLSAISNFFFLPYYPIWSLVVIGLAVFVIWALATAGSPAPRAEPAPTRAEPAPPPSSTGRWQTSDLPGGRPENGEPAQPSTTNRTTTTGSSRE